MKKLLQLLMICFALTVSAWSQTPVSQDRSLPDGKKLAALSGSVAVNSLPATLAVSADGRYVVSLNDGFGTIEAGHRQSLSVWDLQTNVVTDFPDDRLKDKAKQTYFLGLAFSGDGSSLYASMSSISDPEGKQQGDTGNGIAVYSFHNGKITPQRFIKIGLQPLGVGKTAAKLTKQMPPDKLIPFPAGFAVIPANGNASERLLVADNLSDDALLVDAQSGEVKKRFDMSTEKIVPGAYPYAVAVTKDARKAYVSLWNASRVAELDLESGTVKRMIDVERPKTASASGSHPTALLFSADEKQLYVALANCDEIAVVDTASGRVLQRLSSKLPGQNFSGGSPVAMAWSNGGRRLFVANAGTNSVAVFDVSSQTTFAKAEETRGKRLVGTPENSAQVKPSGFIPTEWYPQALAVQGDELGGDLIVASGKGRGVGPNNVRRKDAKSRKPFPYILGLIHGSLARVNLERLDLAEATREVIANNHAGQKAVAVFAKGVHPIKHVIYIIKENRSYDQVFGDLRNTNGDPSLVMYGEDITPNEHKLALEFGILDNFYDSAEVSGDGHNWSTAAAGGDYLEKTIEVSYRGNERTYDYEGENANRVPLEDEMPDVNETGTGYIWSDVAAHKLTYRQYGEFILTEWCNKVASNTSPMEGTPLSEGKPCPKSTIKQGESLPTSLGDGAGTPSPFPWPVPMVAKMTATKPELRGHFDPAYPDFNLEYPDQWRADEFLKEFKGFVANRGKGATRELPNYVLLRLGNDHTSGMKAGAATPSAAVADNDLAVGRIVDAVSHSPYWDDTAILILEDDAQDGPDHVDAHRSIALVISKYSPSSADKPVVDSQFYCTVSMIRTLESLLGLPPMNSNDANALPIASLFAGKNHVAYLADYRNRDNGLIYQMNNATAPGAKESAEMDFTHADRADAAKLNAILWRDRMGDKPMPAMRSVSGTER